MLKLEICCYSVEDAMTAERNGADFVELCSGCLDGGLTPSYGELRQAREHVTVPVFPMVRPRGGDFCYSEREFAAIKDDVALIKELGFPGISFGTLNREGRVNRSQMTELVKLAGNMQISFHRAFDMCSQPFVALEQLTDLGIARIKTSGQQNTAEAGLVLISQLWRKSMGPVIVPSSGIRLTNIHKFIDVGLKEFHSSASRYVSSEMSYRKVGVRMAGGNANESLDEFVRLQVDGELVASMKNALLWHKPTKTTFSICRTAFNM